MKPLEKTANDLFQILRTRFSPVTIGDENAQVTTDPAAARFFSFAYKERNRTHGTVSVSIVSNRSLKVYFSHDMIENIVNTADWHSFLKELRYFAKRNLLGFDARDIQKSQLDTRDFAFIKQNDGPYREEDVEITESAMYGSKRKSMQQFENATLVVYHKRTVDEEKRGARSRHIDSIFIESNHERFRFPINYLNGARAMAVHVSEGGTPYDAIGQHIVTTVSEMQNLAKFARITKRHAMENAEAGEIRDRVVEKYHGIKRDIMRMQNVNNYRQFAETFEPAEAQLDETDVESLKEKFTRQIWNEKMNDLLPSVQRALATESSSETNDIRRLAGMAATEVAEDDIEEFGKSLNDFVKIPLSQKMKLMQRLEQMGAEWMQLRATTPDGETVAYMDPVDDDGDRVYYDYYAKPELMEETELDEASPSVENTIRDPNFVLVLKKDPAADEMIRKTKFNRADGLLSYIMSDIASRIIGTDSDAVANFASEMSINISDEGSSFGTKMTPEYQQDKQLAMQLAKRYLDDVKQMATDPEYADTVRKDPKEVYGARRTRTGGYHEAVEAFESWAEEVFEATAATTGTTGTVGTTGTQTARTNPQVVKALSGGDTKKARDIKRVSDKLARGQRLSPSEMPVAGDIAKSVMTTKKPMAAMQALAQDEHTDMEEAWGKEGENRMFMDAAGKPYDNDYDNEYEESTNSAKDAIIHRLAVLHDMPGLLKQYGLDRVESMIDHVASYYDDEDELGSSDISIMTNKVLDYLKETKKNVVTEKTLRVKTDSDTDMDDAQMGSDRVDSHQSREQRAQKHRDKKISSMGEEESGDSIDEAVQLLKKLSGL